MSLIKGPDLYLKRTEALRDFFEDAGQSGMLRDEMSSLSYLDLQTYLPDDILVKVDRAAMAFGLETRMPLLDYRIVEFAARIPDVIKHPGDVSKWPLRHILERRVPRELAARPKMGLSPPMARWLRGPLREWATAQLAEARLCREGFFEVRELRRAWDQHQQGRRERGNMLWAFLMFQAWHESFFQ